MKSSIKYTLIILGALSLLFYFEWQKPEPVNWEESYSAKDKIPLGNYVLYEMLPDIFPGANIRKSTRSINELATIATPENYLFINDAFAPSEDEFELLLEKVRNGSDVFVAAHHFSEPFREHFGVTVSDTFLTYKPSEDSGFDFRLRFVSKYPNRYFRYKNGMIPVYFSEFSNKGEKLAYNQDNKAVLLRFKEGKGSFLISSVPMAFTNYNMLYGKNFEFVSGTLTYMPVKNVVWDEYYKPGSVPTSSPLRFVLNSLPLRWAYYLTLAAIILYIAFEAKRRQRIIPVIEPPANTSLEFTETIGHLYLHYRDHKNIAEKKILYFLDRIKAQFHIPLKEKETEVKERLIKRMPDASVEIEELFGLIKKVKGQKDIREEELLNLNQRMNDLERKLMQNYGNRINL